MQKAKTLKTFSVRLWWSVAAKVGYIYAKLDFFSYFLLKINVDLQGSSHCVKYRNFTQFPGVEVLRKGTAIRLKLCGNCAFPQNLHTRKLGKITVFSVVNKDAKMFVGDPGYSYHSTLREKCPYQSYSDPHFPAFDWIRRDTRRDTER